MVENENTYMKRALKDKLAVISDEIKKSILIIQVTNSELIALYKNASLFVFPSFAEGFGIPPIEAISYGCQTLCSNQTAMKEFDFLNENFFSPYDIEDLKNKIIKNLNINNTKEQVQSINKKYNWEKVSDLFYKILIDFDSKQ